MKRKSGTSKYLVLALVILGLAFIALLFFNSGGNGIKVQADYYVSKYAPNSLAYFNCKAEGYQTGNKCATCEDLFKQTFDKKTELNLKDDQAVIAYVKGQNLDCVNKSQGGN